MKVCLSRMSLFVLGVGIVFGVARHVKAAQMSGVEIPDTYQIDGRTLVLNGYGLRTFTFLHIKIYVAALYLPQKTSDPQAILTSPGPKLVIVRYIHSGSKDQVQSRYREGEMENCGDGGCDKALEGDFERLVNAAPAVEPGDSTAFVVTDKSLRVSFNGRPLEQYGRGALGNLILAGFIGVHPPSPELRASLLGLVKH
jgi:hypothetical protein